MTPTSKTEEGRCCEKCDDYIPEGPDAGESMCNKTKCPCHQSTPTSDWEEEWDNFKIVPPQLQGPIKNYIRGLLHQEREKLVKRIEGMKKEVGHVLKCKMCSPKCGYNQALSDIIGLLNKDREENV